MPPSGTDAPNLSPQDRGSSAIDVALRELAASAPMELPEIYFDFLRTYNGATFRFAAMGLDNIVFWRAEEVLAKNARYKIDVFAPGFFAVGNDGDERLFALDARGAMPWPVVTLPVNHVDPKESAQLASSLLAFVAACTPFVPAEELDHDELHADTVGGNTLGIAPNLWAMFPAIKAASEFGSFSFNAGLRRTRRHLPKQWAGERVIEYASRDIRVRLTLGGFWGMHVADGGMPKVVWYDLPLFTYLLGGPPQPGMPLDEQLRYAMENWRRIVALFEPSRRARTHTRLQAVKVPR